MKKPNPFEPVLVETRDGFLFGWWNKYWRKRGWRKGESISILIEDVINWHKIPNDSTLFMILYEIEYILHLIDSNKLVPNKYDPKLNTSMPVCCLVFDALKITRHYIGLQIGRFDLHQMIDDLPKSALNEAREHLKELKDHYQKIDETKKKGKCIKKDAEAKAMVTDRIFR